jgi:hypothetical protein
MPSKPIPDRFITYAELAALLNLHIATVKKGECGTDSIPRIRLGKRVLFSFNAVQSWMAAKAREAEESKRRSQTATTNLLNFSQRRRRYSR